MCDQDQPASSTEQTAISAGNTPSYRTIHSGSGSTSTVNSTGATTTGPVRYVLSGIPRTLSYPETIGVIALTLLVPTLTEPLQGSKQTHLMDHLLLHGLGIAVACVIAACICGVFSELHHYYSDCGGLVSISSRLSGSGLAHFVLATFLAASVIQVSHGVTRLSDLIDRQTNFYFADQLHDWSDAARINLITICLILLIFLVSMLGILFVARVSLLLSLVAAGFVIVISGYGIQHKLETSPYRLLTSRDDDVTDVGDVTVRSHGLEDGDVSPLIDKNLHSYIGYLVGMVCQMVTITLLISLSEDNKLKKPVINAVGGFMFVLYSILLLLLNLSLAHITSDSPVFLDQAGLTTGVPTQLITTTTVLTGVAVLLRSSLFLFAVSRVVVYLVVRREESGVDSVVFRLCKIPGVAMAPVCVLSIAALFLHKDDIFKINLILSFIYVGAGAICHTLHRYITMYTEESETMPILGKWGSLKPIKTVKILLGFLIFSSVCLCVSDIMADYIALPTYFSKQLYAVLRISLALVVVGAVSVVASFQQKAGIHKFYRWTLWTPLVPSLVLLLSCTVLVYNWFWGLLVTTAVCLFSLVGVLVDVVAARCCCAPVTADAVY